MAERIPGIIVRVVDDTGIIPPPVFQRYPMYIGCGDPYRQVSDVKIVRSSGSVDDIPALTTINDIVSVGDLPGISKYVESTDYYLVAGSNQIAWQPAGDKPTLGDTFYITYTESRAASAYQATLYFDENLVYEDHGGTTRTNGTLNHLTQAAKLGFDNGAKGLMVLQLDDRNFSDPYSPTNSELETAFLAAVSELELIADYKLLLVGLSSGTLLTTTAANILFNHAVLASQPENKQERSVLMAMPASTTFTQYAAIAQTYAHERMCVPAIPSSLQMTGVTGSYDNRFYNSGLAGKLCSTPIGVTICDEIISGVTFTDNFTVNTLNFLVQNGVSPAKSQNGVVRNVMAITSNTTSALTEDMGVQDVKDYVKKYWREGLWAVYKNKPITRDLPSQMNGSSINMLSKLIEDTIITDYRRISTRQDGTEPRKLKVSGQIKPIFCTNWVDVTFTFVLSFAA